jgi:hypothetical protein
MPSSGGGLLGCSLCPVLGRLDEPAPRCARIWHFGHTFVPGYLRLTGYLHFGGYFTFASYLPFVSNLLRVRCLCPVSQHPGFLHAFTRYPATCTRYHLHVPATTVAHICNRLHVQSCAGTTGRICLPMPVQPVATTPILKSKSVTSTLHFFPTLPRTWGSAGRVSTKNVRKNGLYNQSYAAPAGRKSEEREN